MITSLSLSLVLSQACNWSPYCTLQSNNNQCVEIQCSGNGQSGGYGLFVTTNNNSPGKIGIDVDQGTASNGGPGVRTNSASSNGLEAYASAQWVSGVYGYHGGQGYGVAGRSAAYGVAVFGDNSSGLGWSGYFTGRVYVANYLYKAGGGFMIDHPLDPTNRYLVHSFVESPDMKNIYDGVAVLNASGRATIVLPSYFESLNSDFRYQLTPIGAAASLYVAKEIAANSFEVAGGLPGMKVSWTVTGIRKDAFARMARLQPEVAKAEGDRGRYLNPEAFGQPEALREIDPRRTRSMPPKAFSTGVSAP